MTDDGKIRLKYRWRKTWDDVPDDYVGIDPSRTDRFGKLLRFGRFRLGHIPSGTGWLWYLQWSPDDYEGVLQSGVASTAREAAKSIEDAYESLNSRRPE